MAQHRWIVEPDILSVEIKNVEYAGPDASNEIYVWFKLDFTGKLGGKLECNNQGRTTTRDVEIDVAGSVYIAQSIPEMAIGQVLPTKWLKIAHWTLKGGKMILAALKKYRQIERIKKEFREAGPALCMGDSSVIGRGSVTVGPIFLDSNGRIITPTLDPWTA